MLDSAVRQLEFLSSIDELRRRVDAWATQPSDWEPMRHCQALLKRVLERVETLRVRMEAPLVVATFGGTGTGKSTLVNALVGEDVTRSGRQRPTTLRPILICHSQSELHQLGIPLEECDIVQRDADLLRDVVLLDCPDPDTTEGDSPGSNLDRLRTLLPACDVLLYVSTQQKYRSARVAEELQSAAAGCRMIFVQTRAELDEDIRDDWRQTLAGEYEVPEMFFVDSVRAIHEQQAGHRPSGEMGRLIDLLLNKLRASERVRVRRINALDLLLTGLSRCQEILSAREGDLQALDLALVEQRQVISQRMAQQLQAELLASRSLWERRLLSAVTDRWGMSPFSAVLRMYNGLGAILASTVLLRARSTAQLALLGTVQSVRWLEGKRKEQVAETSLQRLSSLGLDDTLLREAEIVIGGHVATAGFSGELLHGRNLEELRRRAAVVEDQFVGDASGRIDGLINELSQRNSRWWIRGVYELLLATYLAFILYRVGKNFFYDSFVNGLPLLSSDFYLAAGLFLLLCCGLLITGFTRRLRRGLEDRIQKLVAGLVEARLGQGLFPGLESAARQAHMQRDEVSRLLIQTQELRHDVSGLEHLGGWQGKFRKNPQAPAL